MNQEQAGTTTRNASFPNFTKVCCLGTVANHSGRAARYAKVFVTICFKNERLALSGVEGPQANGDCLGAAGQIVMHEWQMHTYSSGWDLPQVERLRAIWKRWHLNDMRAGSPAQEDYLRAHPIRNDADYYTTACQVLADVGRNPDPNYMHNGSPYVYGAAWITERVPHDVLEWLAALPKAEIVSPWRT